MITAIIIISSVFLLVLAGILFFPLRIVFNTTNKEYYINLPGILRVDLIFAHPLNFSCSLKIFGVKLHIRHNQKKKMPPLKKRKMEKKQLKNPLLLIPKMANCFKVRYVHLNIDTGDFPLNAQLIALSGLFNNEKRNVCINFENINEAEIQITTRIFMLITTYIKHILSNK